MDETEAWFKRNIPSRKWAEICAEWINFLPEIDTPGSRPLMLSEDLEEFKKIASEIPAQGSIITSVEGFRELAFQEAVFLLHKCSHVVGVSERHVKADVRTWALSDSYHGALFGAKSSNIFLGIQFAKVGNRNYLIDLFPEPEKKKGKPVTVEPEIRPIKIIPFNKRPEHRHHWAIFQRLLRITSIESVFEKYLGILDKQIEYKGIQINSCISPLL